MDGYEPLLGASAALANVIPPHSPLSHYCVVTAALKQNRFLPGTDPSQAVTL